MEEAIVKRKGVESLSLVFNLWSIEVLGITLSTMERTAASETSTPIYIIGTQGVPPIKKNKGTLVAIVHKHVCVDARHHLLLLLELKFPRFQ